ncbi:MAG TPA: VacJ family lipoprotein [Azospirillum sp.]|nr:VacJ family lipoprotein [Azospirillum sp.]
MMPASLSRRFLRTAFAATLALAMAGCASGPKGAAHEEVNDPLEVPNRFVFAANEAVDILAIRPAAEIYHGTVPDPVRQAVANVLANLLAPLVIGNSLLQGDVQNASDATGRFLTNTILGVGGVFDVASAAGVPAYRSEDFGQTLGTWGVGDGPYLVLPLIGRSNARDAVGYGADTLADPFRIGMSAINANGVLYTRTGVSAVDSRSQILKEVDDLRRNSVDFYATARSLYGQQRNAQIRNSRAVDSPEFPDFDKPAPSPVSPMP